MSTSVERLARRSNKLTAKQLFTKYRMLPTNSSAPLNALYNSKFMHVLSYTRSKWPSFRIRRDRFSLRSDNVVQNRNMLPQLDNLPLQRFIFCLELSQPFLSASHDEGLRGLGTGWNVVSMF